MRPSSYLTYYYRVPLCKPLFTKPIDEIKRADIAMLLHEIVDKCAKHPAARRAQEGLRGRISARAVQQMLSTIFKWAMGEGICEANPVIGTNDPAKGVKARNRVLTDDELAAVWRGCGDDDFGRVIKLLILTGCRRSEIGGLKWSEINMDTGVMVIPGERTKNHHELILALPPMALDILREVPRQEAREFIFGCSGKGFTAFDRGTDALRARIAAREGKPLDHWTRHDLRRTMRTGLGKCTVPPHIAERVINHVQGGVEAVYDRYTYDREIKTALGIWADHVASIVEGKQSNVAVLKRA
jgi:integrase